MAINSRKNEECEQALKKAWAWQRSLASYKKDYAQQAEWLNKRPLLGRGLCEPPFHGEILSKWGYYPLDDPTEKESPVGFTKFFLDSFAKGIYGRAVEPVNITWLELLMHDRPMKTLQIKLPKTPKKLRVDIDYTQSKKLIDKELSYLIGAVKDAYKIEDSRPRAEGLYDQYRATVYKALGKSSSEILKLLSPQIKDPHTGESHRKRAERIIKKT